MRASYGLSRYQAAETDMLLNEQRAHVSGRGCLLFGGRGQDTERVLADADAVRLALAITDAGVPTFHAAYGNVVGWGNDAMLTRAGTARTYQQTAQGVATDKVVLVGISMGTVAALRYAKANPTLVSGIALILPLPDIQYVYDNNLLGFQAEVGTAYGARPSDAQTPARNASSYTTQSVKGWYSTDDPIATPTQWTAFATAAGAASVSLGAAGHTFTSLAMADVAAYVRSRAS